MGQFTQLRYQLAKTLPGTTTGDSSTSSPTVVGGPGKALHRDTASSLLGIGTKIIFLRDKAKINNGIVDNGTASSLIEVSSMLCSWYHFLSTLGWDVALCIRC